MLLATHSYAARSDILNDKTPFSSFPSEAEKQCRRSFKKL
jgi:hypothetical protein